MVRRPRVTQKEIAARANVSQTLVSLVLSGATIDVAESTRQQILDAAESLGYKQKSRPRAANRQRLLAYIRPVVERGHHTEGWIYDAYDQYYDRIQNLLLEAAYREGYSLTVRPYKNEHELTHWLSEWGVDGVIWHGTGSMVEWIAERHPTVQLWRDSCVKADAVSSNQRETITLAMDYLLKRGHTRIFLPFTTPVYYPRMRERSQVYEEYIAEHCLPHWKTFFPKQLTARFDKGEVSISNMLKIIQELLERPEEERPTAILTGDHSALYLIKSLSAQGYRIPDAMSFVGVDNIAASALIHPGLTSLDNQLNDICTTAIALLISRIKTPELAYRKISITPRLIERESVATLNPTCKTPSTLHTT